MNDFCTLFAISQLEPEHQGFLDSSVSIPETEYAIDNTKINKAPGTNGFTAKFYKKRFKGPLVWACLVFKQIHSSPMV